MSDPIRAGARREGQPAGGERGGPTWVDWVAQPRSLVFATLLLAAGVGGGSRIWRAWQARRAANRLTESDVTPAEVVAAAAHGRAVLPDLYPLLDPAARPELREAAAAALAVLWRKDELVAEEEKAVATRVHQVVWRSRRRYPRAIRRPIPVEVAVTLPGLDVPGLEWSGRVRGARRASVETGSGWMPVGGSAIRFEIVPGDFTGRGPHELVIEPRLRHGGGAGWEHDLPHARHTIEFDPLLTLEALQALPDAAREERAARAVRPLEPAAGKFVALNEGLAVRGPLGVEVDGSVLPNPLAHRIDAELEGVDGVYQLGEVVAGEGGGLFAFETIEPVPAERLPGPTAIRLRYRLAPDAELGWCEPGMRSMWPGEVVTEWGEVEVVRR